MARKRKRSQKKTTTEPARDAKKAKRDASGTCFPSNTGLIQHPTLRLYYPNVLTLRAYLLSRLSGPASKARIRKVVDAGTRTAQNGSEPILGSGQRLAELLDKTLVCFHSDTIYEDDGSLQQDFAAFSQQSSLTPGSSLVEGTTPQSERVGAQKNALNEQCGIGNIPGVVSHYPNSHVNTLKSSVWIDTLGLLGKAGDKIMLELVLKCGIFMAVANGKSNLYQLSGTPLTELRPLADLSNLDRKAATKSLTTASKEHISLAERLRDVLNRYPDSNQFNHTMRVMQYVFPRQFGLHNVFTSTVDSRETKQPFQDYTLREQEIAQKCYRPALELRSGAFSGDAPTDKCKLPRRLRGSPVELVKKLQRNHSRCSYVELLKHYCDATYAPSPSRATGSRKMAADRQSQLNSHASDPSQSTHGQAESGQVESPTTECSFMDIATPASNVSAFCRAVLTNLIPDHFWGEGDDGKDNKTHIMFYVDRFVHLRKFESLSLHTVFQGVKMKAITWLSPPRSEGAQKMALSDMQKRTEIFLEFLYYLFDSLLIPLIRSNFHVTESNVHRNRLFYFRHDVWRALAEPTLAKIRGSMFEEVNTMKALKVLGARTLGFSQVRLLPKTKGMRPIMNLRRRVNKSKNGKPVLGRSINSIMTPVFNILEYLRKKHPASVGSALFSVGDMYPKLKAFQNHTKTASSSPTRFYFAKCDVQACFDTIPQKRVVQMVRQKLDEDLYRICRHAEIKNVGSYRNGSVLEAWSKPARKFAAAARSAGEFINFDSAVENELASGKRNTVFVDFVLQACQQRKAILALLEEHVEANMVKIGKKFYKQKAGIPQGSILSSLLCNLFYAELEHEYLSFLQDDESLLLRLIDDFLLVTTNKNHASRFLRVMHGGIEPYGVKVNPAKSLTNFEASVDGKIAHCKTDFPYCGNLINTTTLEITKDRDRRKESVLSDSLTVEESKMPGKTFYRKTLNAFKIQTHRMFLDTTFNSRQTVLATVYKNFYETAMKFYRYQKCMRAAASPHATLLVNTIRDLGNLAYTLVKAKHQDHALSDYNCAISKGQVQWLAAQAFRNVLKRKQTHFVDVIDWLDSSIASAAPTKSKEAWKLAKAVKEGNVEFRGYQY
ncbi:MAG: hypothetical protein Q9191_006514 [Dirinaria sp. TL-2023a]